MNITDSNKFKRVLILTQYFEPEPGAPQIRLSAMIKELRKQDITVEVITSFPSYPLGKVQKEYRGKFHLIEKINGVVIRRFWSYPASGRNILKRLLCYLSFMFSSSVPLLFSRRPDIVFVEAQPMILAIPAFLMKLFRGVPYIYNTPDLQIEHAEDDKWITITSLINFAKFLESFLMKQSLSVTTVTDAFKIHFSKYRDIKLSKITMLPNGADVHNLHPMPFDISLAKKFEVGNRKVITFAGTHAHYQGLEIIIKVAELLKKRKDIVFLMIGNGPVREGLIKLASDKKLTNILFKQSPIEEMVNLMSITYVSLVVIRDIPISRKMRLSKAIPPISCGVPVIYSGYGETPKIFLRHNAGLQVEPENPLKLAETLVNIVENPKLRDAMLKNARKLALDKFSWEKIVSDWIYQINNLPD